MQCLKPPQDYSLVYGSRVFWLKLDWRFCICPDFCGFLVMQREGLQELGAQIGYRDALVGSPTKRHQWWKVCVNRKGSNGRVHQLEEVV